MKTDQAGRVFDFSVNLRGVILTKAIHIERKMDDYISSYFCDTEKKKNQLCEYLLFTERTNFDVKRQIFVAIVTQENKEFIKNNSTFLKALEKVAPERNIFAHLEINTDKLHEIDTLEQVSFKRYKGGVRKDAVYNSEKIKNLSKSLSEVIKGFDTLLTSKTS